MKSSSSFVKALSWEELGNFSRIKSDPINGPTNAQSKLRLFGHKESDVRVILYRDHHAWCPYCQKVWLWLEWKEIPYKVKKVTMKCYGKKEDWYLSKVQNGMLPALEIDQTLITESDLILLNLESIYGGLGKHLDDPDIIKLRKLERQLFSAWCRWLCYPNIFPNQNKKAGDSFDYYAKKLEEKLSLSNGPWLDNSLGNPLIPSSADIIFIPYLERMNASLAYYKGILIRDKYPKINNWFCSLEKLATYKGTQGDFHTHAHDLPPQMGGCFKDNNANQKEIEKAIDSGQGLDNHERFYPEEENSKFSALGRVLKHKQNICLVNPLGEKKFDQPLRAALTHMMLEKNCIPEKDSAIGLRYLRDRISIPRDMDLLAGRKLRCSLEKTAALDSKKAPIPIKTVHRLDQDPAPFLRLKEKAD